MTDLLVAVAMQPEAEPFLGAADAVGAPRALGHAEQTDLTFGGRTVRLLRTGIGGVNATAAVAVALHELGPVPVVSAGSAGGLGLGVRVGDVVVGERYLFAGADATAFGYQRGQIPGMPVDYAGDPAMLAAARGAGLADGAVLVGTMLSGDAFVDARTVEAVRTDFPDALSTDMETTAIAQTCYLAGVPFLGVRGISDLCGPAAGDDFRTHVDDAADRSLAVVLALLDAVG
ncbi:5'-methylthioadenosine/S-adenosylhomocysteine nucleosidase [Isoptericola sp. b441]|uniref:adenosylhomocysteine nucleosidase n=1 Tax=Actinotalea lenta TaxID=3064654 RepID=A0ABT9D903_9CELL|nr:5'-methylthioadenosine/S-adenosylhomocysteine nucleosidase [Isoptericola sp. b441]MDO8106941.1 5'-methylthioadenosine/S-adenosylhomocysteine nucleosidase [Isoptericola sp. b441]